MKPNQTVVANQTASAQGNKASNSEVSKNGNQSVVPVLIPLVKNTATEKKEPEKKSLSLDELTERAERLNLQRIKYEEIKGKRKQLQAFQISHDEKNAQLTIVDAKGDKITTNSPVSISQVISIWGTELDDHLSKVENEMRAILEATI